MWQRLGHAIHSPHLYADAAVIQSSLAVVAAHLDEPAGITFLHSTKTTIFASSYKKAALRRAVLLRILPHTLLPHHHIDEAVHSARTSYFYSPMTLSQPLAASSTSLSMFGNKQHTLYDTLSQDRHERNRHLDACTHIPLTEGVGRITKDCRLDFRRQRDGDGVLVLVW